MISRSILAWRSLLLCNRDGNSLIMSDIRADNDTTSALINYQQGLVSCARLFSNQCNHPHYQHRTKQQDENNIHLKTFQFKVRRDKIYLRIADIKITWSWRFVLNEYERTSHEWDIKYWKLKCSHRYCQKILGFCHVCVSHKWDSWNKDIEMISRSMKHNKYIQNRQ